MRLTGSGTYSRAAPVPRMPPGLVELMEGLTKDVLRNNPTNIYEFCANHMEKLIEIRDGPSRKKVLTLEEKIAIAQKKVRQRAKEQQQLYDNEMLNAATTEPEKDESDHEAPNSSQQEHINLRSPIHHEQDLSLASEVEISHEPSTDNSLTSKDSIVEADELPISKSSTVSSISKSTVIDLLNNDQEITNKEDIEDDNGLLGVKEDLPQTLNLLNEFDAQKEKPDETSIQEYESHIISDAIDQNVLKETPFIPDKEISAKEFDVALKNEIDTKNDPLEKSKSVNLDPKNQIVDTGSVNDSMVTSIIEVSKISPKPTEAELVHTAVLIDSISSEPTKSQIDDYISIDDTNVGISFESISNVINEQSANNQIAEDEPSPAKAVETLEDSSLTDSDNNLISHVQSPSEILTYNSDTNENPTQVVDESNDEDTAKVGYEQSDVIEIAEINKETEVEDQTSAKHNSSPEVLSKNLAEVENHYISKENQNEVGIKEIKIDSEENVNKDAEVAVNEDKNLIMGRRESTNNDEYIVEDKKEEEKNYENEITTAILNPDIIHNDTSNVSIGTEVRKAEEDVPQNDIENVQNNMDLETAAVTIQKVFRSFLFKSRNSTFEDITNDEAISLDEDNDKKEEYYAAANLNQDRRPLGLTRMDTVLQTVNEEKSLSLSTDDSSTLSSAATTIQAHVRGFLVRNRLNSYKTVSTNSLVNSNEMLDTDSDQKSKTVLNIHIVPEQANYLSRDESLITSMDLSLDGSPPSSVNLHPLSYDHVSERRKLLKREDAIQSVSPPSNNSGKLSEDSVKEVLVNENDATKIDSNINEKGDQPNADDNSGSILTAVSDVTVDDTSNEPVDVEIIVEKRKSPMSPDESDVVTPFAASPHNVGDFENTSRLLHSGEFHDVLLPTKVSRSDTTVVREFKNVLAYIILWNTS